MPVICTFRGIKIYINYSDHMPPHFMLIMENMNAVSISMKLKCLMVICQINSLKC